MPSMIDQLYSQALSLSPSDRAALAGRLLDDLEGPVDPGVEAAWMEEIEHRLNACDRGEIQPVPAGEVMDQMRCASGHRRIRAEAARSSADGHPSHTATPDRSR